MDGSDPHSFPFSFSRSHPSSFFLSYLHPSSFFLSRSHPFSFFLSRSHPFSFFLPYLHPSPHFIITLSPIHRTPSCLYKNKRKLSRLLRKIFIPNKITCSISSVPQQARNHLLTLQRREEVIFSLILLT